MSVPDIQAPIGRQRPIAGRRFKKKHGFLFLIVILLLLVAVQVLIEPWAFHIGGKFTPMMSWTGMATGTAPRGGGSYAVQLKLQAEMIGDHNCSGRGCSDFHGSATVCTAAGSYSFSYVSGKVGGWTSLENQKMSLEIANGTTRGTKTFSIDFDGVWHGNSYVAAEGGDLVQYFDAKGAPRPAYTSPNPADQVRMTFQPGDFTRACQALRHS